jgi:peptide-methionine (S)-S-oxide reductase
MIKSSLLIALSIAVALGLVANAAAQSKPSEKVKAKSTQAPSEKQSEPEAQKGASSNSTEKPKSKPKIETATFGGGCFWCMEAVFERIPGVKSVVSGFSGGRVPNPTYEEVLTGLTGHAEVIQIVFDPSVISFDKLLHFFWSSHDPTTLNSQGPDIGPQYRSIILYHNEEQQKTALKQYRELMAARRRRSPIVTELVPFAAFYPAEAYHQHYFQNHPYEDYSQMHIVPKVRKLQQKLRNEARESGGK